MRSLATVLAQTSLEERVLSALVAALHWLGSIALMLVDWAGGQFAGPASGDPLGPAGSPTTPAGPSPPTILLAGGLATLALLIAVMAARQGVSRPGPARDNARPPPSPKPPAVEPQDATAAPTPQRAIGPAARADRRTRAGRSRHEARNVHRRGFAVAAAAQADSAATQRRSANWHAQVELGRRAGTRFDGTTLEALLDHVADTGVGTPHLLQQGRVLRLELDPCGGCQPAGGAPQAALVGSCPFETGFLEGAFGQLFGTDVVAREAACRQGGAERCVFEIWT